MRAHSLLARLIPVACWAALLLRAATGCEPSPPRAPEETAPPPAAIAPAERTMSYSRVHVAGPATLRSMRDSLGAASFLDLLRLNRLDLAHVRKGDSLIVPLAPFDHLILSPFPREVAAIDSVARCLFVSLRVQAFAAYEGGHLVRWGPTSTGRRESPTPAGLYHANWKDKERASTVNEEWLLTWYVNLDNLTGVSFHQYDLPGRPASHSCVRLLEEDARWIYQWVEQWELSEDGLAILRHGTPVVIFGDYAFGARAPWRRLPEDAGATTIVPEELRWIARGLSLRQDLRPPQPPESASEPAPQSADSHAAGSPSSRSAAAAEAASAPAR